VVHEQVRDKLDVAFEDMGEQQVKNIARPVHVYRVTLQPLQRKGPLPNPPPRAGAHCRSPTSRRSRCCPLPI
jgi:hypothetical protein